jgi:DNA-binding response OmpR family regulator
MQSFDQSSPPARVALLSDRWLTPREWSQRGMSAVRLRPMAFERLLADPPEAIVLDPACGDARQVADCWQLHDLLHVPVIILAEGAPSDDVLALLERGAQDVVTEPPDAALLAARVAAILRRSRRQALQRIPPVVNLGGVEVDMVRRVVRRPGGCQSLSRTEFNLLLAFLRTGGRTCTHHELMTHVWGTECASATHYLRLYIRYLREKIEDDPRRPARILNVWGVGYRLALGAATAAFGPAVAEAALPLSAIAPNGKGASTTGARAPRGARTPVAEETAWTSSSLSLPPPRPTRRRSLVSATTASR